MNHTKCHLVSLVNGIIPGGYEKLNWITDHGEVLCFVCTAHDFTHFGVVELAMITKYIVTNIFILDAYQIIPFGTFI